MNELPPFLRGMAPEPDPELAKALDALYDKQAEIEIAWRRTTTGPWACLFCTCKNPFTWKPTSKPDGRNCAVHGRYMITREGEIL